MKNAFYETRKKQMQAFARFFRRKEISLPEVLKDACICGAAEERWRILGILKSARTLEEASKIIVSQSVNKVLGY